MRPGQLLALLILSPLVLRGEVPSDAASSPAPSSVPATNAALPLMRSALPPPRPEAAPTPSLVCFALDQQAMGPGMTPRLPVVSRMVAALVCTVTGKPTPVAAWRSLVKPGDRVGIKVSTGPGPVGGTHPAVAQAVVEGLVAAGVPAANITVWDRRREDLVQCGFDQVPGMNLRWIEKGGGHDPRAVLSAPTIGQLVYGDLSFRESRSSLSEILGPRAQLSNESHLPVLLSREVDKVINIPSLCDSYYSGVHGALAGMTIGILDNWRRFAKGDGGGDAALAEIYADERIGGKVVFTIMDGMVLQYAGGPYPSPVNCVTYAALFASRDPVAIDATALRLIDEQRLLSKMPKASGDGGHVKEAEASGLGHADEKMIRLRRIGVGGGAAASSPLAAGDAPSVSLPRPRP